MTRRRKRLLLGAIAVAMLTALAIEARARLWLRASFVRVMADGASVSDWSTFRNLRPPRRILIVSRRSPDVYVLDMETGAVGIPNRGAFVDLAWCVFSKEREMPTAPLSKLEQDSGYKYTPSMIEFSGSRRRRIQVGW